MGRKQEKTISERSEIVTKMLAHATLHAQDSVLDRGKNPLSAFDHDLVAWNGSFTATNDRVKLCPPEKPCAICRARMKASA